MKNMYSRCAEEAVDNPELASKMNTRFAFGEMDFSDTC